MGDDLSTTDILCLKMYFLKKLRSALVDKFASESPELFIPMFDFENDKTLTQLSIEKYFITWLDSHWIEIENFFAHEKIPVKNRSVFEAEFAESYLQLINSILLSRTGENLTVFSRELYQEKIAILSKIITSGEKQITLINRMKLSYGRDKRLFDRQIKSIQESDCELPNNT